MFGIQKLKTQVEALTVVNQHYLDIIDQRLAFLQTQIEELRSSHVQSSDFEKKKRELLAPFLEAKWAHDKAVMGQNVLNKGIKIVEERKRLHDEIIVKERQGENVVLLKERLGALNWVLEEISDAT